MEYVPQDARLDSGLGSGDSAVSTVGLLIFSVHICISIFQKLTVTVVFVILISTNQFTAFVFVSESGRLRVWEMI